MAGLIVKLQSQHERILQLLDQAKEFGCMSSESQKLLGSAKQLLLEHLRQEDSELYPVLREASTQNPKITETLLIYAMDMSEITKLANSFFRNCEQGGTDKELAHEFGLLHGKLRSRIRREEEVLYPLYVKVAKARAA